MESLSVVSCRYPPGRLLLFWAGSGRVLPKTIEFPACKPENTLCLIVEIGLAIFEQWRNLVNLPPFRSSDIGSSFKTVRDRPETLLVSQYRTFRIRTNVNFDDIEGHFKVTIHDSEIEAKHLNGCFYSQAAYRQKWENVYRIVAHLLTVHDL